MNTYLATGKETQVRVNTPVIGLVWYPVTKFVYQAGQARPTHVVLANEFNSVLPVQRIKNGK